jgi:hypothetical protein
LDCWAVRLAPDGKLVWQKTYGGSLNEIFYDIQPTADGGFVAAGITESNNGDIRGGRGGEDAWVARLGPDGGLIWQKSLGGPGHEYFSAIQQTADGGFAAAGRNTSAGGDVANNRGHSDMWVVKLSPDGAIEWEKSLGGSGKDFATSIQQTADGGFVAAGLSESSNGDVSGNRGSSDAWFVKLSPDGALEWEKPLGGSLGELANSVQQTADGGYVAAGWSFSKNGDVGENRGHSDAWVVKLGPDSAFQWGKVMGGSSRDSAASIQQTADGGLS